MVCKFEMDMELKAANKIMFWYPFDVINVQRRMQCAWLYSFVFVCLCVSMGPLLLFVMSSDGQNGKSNFHHFLLANFYFQPLPKTGLMVHIKWTILKYSII